MKFALLLSSALAVATSFASDFDRLAGEFDDSIRPILTRYCLDCHDADAQKGELDLERFASLDAVRQAPEIWSHVREQLLSGEMPPEKKPQPEAGQREALLDWVGRYLDAEALANAGDPGAVVLRRLSNMEFTYTIRDLTGVESLDPAREFPIDGAAGEGFTNVGSALVMSPALLTKYLDAAKEVASHAVILPDRITFSPSASRADWTQEKLDAIRSIYSIHSAPGAESAQDLQGVRFSTTDGGVIPVERYLRAILTGEQDGLSPKYLAMLRVALEGGEPSALLDPIRARWREAKPEDAAGIAEEIAAWQRGLWHFAKIGHIGKRDGPPGWQIPVSPIETAQSVQLKIAASEAGPTLFLAAGNAGDGAEGDTVIWKDAVLKLPNEEPIPLSRLKAMGESVLARQERELRKTAAYLKSCAEGSSGEGLDPAILAAWGSLVRLGGESLTPTGHLAGGSENFGGYAFVRALGAGLPIVLVNQSESPVDITTLTVPARGLTVHPTPTEDSIVIWRSPVSGKVRIKGSVADADNKCGNGAAWALELVNSSGARKLAGEPFANGGRSGFDLAEELTIRAGDLVRLTVASHESNHTCDTTALTLTIAESGGEGRVWDLAGDVVDRLGEGNPLADSLGNPAVWHFCKSGAAEGKEFAIPADSALGKWRTANEPDAEAVRKALLAPESEADKAVAAEVRRWRGPFRWIDGSPPASTTTEIEQTAPSSLEFPIPVGLIAEGAEFSASVELHPDKGKNGSVQAFATLTKPPTSPAPAPALAPGTIEPAGPGSGRSWTAGTPPMVSNRPVLVRDGSEAQRRFREDIVEFQALFPAALCYRKIVPVDEVVTLTLRHREDDFLRRLMLDDSQTAELDRLWDELIFVSRQPMKQLDAYNQLWQYATQDADPSAFEPMREPVKKAAAEFESRLIAVEPTQVRAAIDFAEQAWRQPLTEARRAELSALYKSLRRELEHEDAVRQLLARVLVAPAFLYRGEIAAPGVEAVPVNDWELATRLSYFLWSSAPDAELRASAAAGELRDPEVLAAQTRRMISDPKIRRLATEFGAQWLHVRDVATLDEKSERHFPTFLSLREDMQEETVRFFMDLFQNDRSVLSLLDADHSFVNRPLAEHYGLEVAGDAGWRRVDGLQARGRGGILGFSATLAKHSGASRTSPILRGNWVSEVILGERLPRPPKDVPVLPNEAPVGLTERQLIERHSSDPSCARCHAKIDPLGFALEGFDAIGRARGDVDTRAELADGTQFDGIAGLRSYLVESRREDFVRQFSRKLLGYALGRSVQLSDKPLLDEMVARLAENEFRVQVAVEMIVRSPQFRNVRGKD